MDKHAVAIVLDEIGTLLELHGENKFKARAFTGAARAVERLEEELTTVAREGRLETISGVGPATAAVIRELINTGTSLYYQQLRDRTPDGLLELLAVPRLGTGRIRTLHEELGVATLDDLERAARANRVAPLKGFGEKTQDRILEGIAYVRTIMGRRRYAEAIELGQRLRGFAAALPEVIRVELVGELRRGCETVNALVLAMAVEPEHADRTVEQFLNLPGIARAERHTHGASARLSDGVQLDLKVVPDDEFATAVLFATGSESHLARLRERAQERSLELTAHGLFDHGARLPLENEAAVYSALGLAFVEPELRETGVEIDAARSDALPALISYEDLRGCFHCHSNYSDGKATIAEMAEAAHERGWRYLGIADHSQFAGYAGGLSPDEIRAQHDEIDQWNRQHGKRLWILKGIEADILADGRLDYEDQPGILASFDYVIGSVHSSFALPREAQTQRFLRAIQNPYLTLLGHLTGRLLLSRKGYELDLAAIFSAAATRGIGIEINSDPHRMELDWRHWPAAKRLGIRTAINPDAHSPRQLDFVHYGTVIARKGWLEQKDVINCWSLAEVKRFFQRTRKA
ncbi:MAG TPA: DNA polymerase/3'-5' exonuclease PolX [Longimicrobiales bacterium]|nr:DNA polymerase/3'-5' exonuclease PolX [Longimicrobiales bacterium]